MKPIEAAGKKVDLCNTGHLNKKKWRKSWLIAIQKSLTAQLIVFLELRITVPNTVPGCKLFGFFVLSGNNY